MGMDPAVYARVSTVDQDRDRQLKECTEYLLNQYDVDRGEIDYYQDTGSGGDMGRNGFQQLLDAAEGDRIDSVVVHEISRLSRSIGDLSATIERLESAGVSLHIVSRDLTIDPTKSDPMTEAMMYLMGIFAQLERDMLRERTRSGIRAAQREGKHTGRTPYGFDTDSDGYLTPNEDYETAVVALERLQAGDSKRSVAKATGISRRTLGRVEDRAEMYDTP